MYPQLKYLIDVCYIAYITAMNHIQISTWLMYSLWSSDSYCYRDTWHIIMDNCSKYRMYLSIKFWRINYYFIVNLISKKIVLSPHVPTSYEYCIESSQKKLTPFIAGHILPESCPHKYALVKVPRFSSIALMQILH